MLNLTAAVIIIISISVIVLVVVDNAVCHVAKKVIS